MSDPSTSIEGEQPGAQIGRYKLLEQIGEGGMGTIWMAEQREPVKRRVALKIIKLGMDTKQVIARFEAERQALAMMDHPHIAKVLDAGATETGRPYFVMEYIKGIPILEYCDKERLDTRARLDLFTNVCHAIQHAHHKGIIHRDIKPSNVLVTMHDGLPVPKVIDFGIAKATNSELTTKTLFTEHRQMVGTPAYMSPEQAEMSGLDIDTRSDIYSLGVLLYELLTGTTPFDTKALLESGLAEMMRAIREDEPHKPSTRISTMGDTGTRTAQQRRIALKKLSALLRGDLDWIVMKCLEKDRTRRYETANGLAADIKRHIHDEPITAGAPSTGYKLRKFVKRNRARVFAASAMLAALLIAIVGTSWGLVERNHAQSAQLQRQAEDDQRTAAESARLARNAQAVSTFLGQCEEALRAGDQAKAKIAMTAARAQALEGGAEHDASRLVRLDADLAFAIELDAIDQFLWTWADNRFGNPAVAATRARAALRDFGADPDVVPLADAVERVNASAILDRIVLALDRMIRHGSAVSLRAVLHRVDDDPYRNAYRDAVVAKDVTRQTQLADEPSALDQPPEFAAALSGDNAVPIERRRELLQVAVARQPSDIVLLMTLQASYSGSQDTRDERVRWLQAAIAADPENSGAYTNLGLALNSAGQTDAALACNRKAVALNPRNAVACNNLAAVLIDSNLCAEALPWLDASIANDSSVDAYTNRGRALHKLGRVDEALAALRFSANNYPEDAMNQGFLGEVLKGMGQVDEAQVCFRKAILLDPAWPTAYGGLGELLQEKGETSEAIACFRKAVQLDPKNVGQHARLGDALGMSRAYDEAILCYQKCIEIDPHFDAYGGLGSTLKALGRVDEAIPHLRKSLEIRPDHAPAMQALSGCLVQKGRADEALALARRVVELLPLEGSAHLTLGFALHGKGLEEESIACYRKAVELDPKEASALHNLGATAFNNGRLEESLSYYQRAVDAEPKFGQWRLDLALVLHDLNRHVEARQSFRQAVELNPKLAIAHYNLGIYEAAERHWDAALDHYRQTIAIDPSYAEAHCNMASCLQNEGRFAEALHCRRRGHELGSKRSDWRYPSADWVKADERLAAIEAKLPALVAGKWKPVDDAERLETAPMCHVKQLYRSALGLWTEAFAADPALADDLAAGHRYGAAAAAVLASGGSGKDASPLDEPERARWRRQAADWLRADLALREKSMESGKAEDRAAVETALREWLKDADFAGVRDAAALSLLPEEDQATFGRLWADVATLLARAQAR